MLLHDLFEAGIKTAQLDTLARRALRDALPQVMQAVIADITPHLPPARPVRAQDEWEREAEERRDYADRVYDYIHDHPDAALNPFLEAVQSVLLRVTREYARQAVLRMPGVMLYHGSVRNVEQNVINEIKVVFEFNDTSEDSYKDRLRGYYQDWDTLIKVFVDRDKLRITISGYLMEILHGEDSENNTSEILTAILPTYLHEYAHFEQFMRRYLAHKGRLVKARREGKPFDKETPTRDFIYVTPRGYAKGQGRKGKRGGYARDTKGHTNFARYLGSQHEIDSWATSAAAEIANDLQDDSVRGETGWSSRSALDYNQSIQELQSNIANGWVGSDSHAFETYKNFIRKAFRGFYDEVSGDEYPQQSDYKGYDSKNRTVIDRKQIEKVWKIFCKKVASKLDDYKKDVAGNSSQTADTLNRDWLMAVKDGNAADGIATLARWIASDIIEADDPYTNRIRNILNGYAPLVDKAEEFLRTYYLGPGRRHKDGYKQWAQQDDYQPEGWRKEDALADKLQEIFRRLVARNLEKLDPENYGPDSVYQQAA